ncbi:MAG: hypothetical protein WAK40_03540 [Thermoplasmata archaeon]
MTPPTLPLDCPSCHRSFNYEYIPGASVSAVRLGGRRYMRCPLCGKFAFFDLRSPRNAGTPPSPHAATFNDRRLTLRWLALFVAPAVAVVTGLGLLLPRPEPAVWAALGGAMVIVVGSLVLVYLGAISPNASDPGT